jgi:hypothetical protein
MGMWDEIADGLFTLKQLHEYWREPSEEFFEAFLRRPLGARRLPTFSEYLGAIEQAIHAESKRVAAQLVLVMPVLHLVQRVITRDLLDAAEITADEGHGGAVT